MNWILIAITSGMLMTKGFDTEEACLGRKAMLEKDKITNSKCIDMSPKMFSTGSGTLFCSNGIC
jgi:hypothetical protein